MKCSGSVSATRKAKCYFCHMEDINVNFLSKYSDSMPIFRIIFPALVVQSVISIVMQNNFKKAEGDGEHNEPGGKNAGDDSNHSFLKI